MEVNAPTVLVTDEQLAIPQAANDPVGPARIGFAVDCLERPLEGGTDPQYGTVTWRTLMSGEDRRTSEFVLGIAEFGPYGTLNPHRHDPAEFYLGLEGEATVTVDGVPLRIAPGVAVYIPGSAEHGVVAGAAGARFAYGFAVAAFSDIAYRFSTATSAVA